MDRPRIVIIGSGNVATHLGLALADDNDVVQVFSRNYDNARRLADLLPGCRAVSDYNKIVKDADLYIISVKDDAISDVVENLPEIQGVIVHTSGSVGIEVLGDLGTGRGVLYPLQTFTKGVDVAMNIVPFFNEANDKHILAFIDGIARQISGKVFHADSSQRANLHIAAVFACNFANLMWTISDEILNESGYDISVFKPLLEATLAKAISVGPAESQTGPAKRGDTELMKKHLARLSGKEKEIYRLLSDTILERFNHNSDEQNRL